MQSQSSTFTNKAGYAIFRRTWLPDEAPRGIMVLVHGLNSHSVYYQWTAEQFVAHGYAVYAFDWQGRGQSEGERFYTENIYDAVADVDHIVDLAKEEHQGLPLFLLGHSAGGVIACLYALEHGEKLSGLICESFAFRVPAPDIALAILKGVSHLAPHLHTIHLQNEYFSRDPAVVASMNADPLIENESQPSKTMEQLVKADERLEREFPKITVPLLIIHGTADKATKPGGSEFFYAQACSADKTLKLCEGHYHDLLNDVDKEVVMGDVVEWVEGRG